MYDRIVSVFTLNRGCLYRTKNFVPDYPYTSSFLDFWSIDEIVALDITRDPGPSRGLFDEAITRIAKHCFVPLSVGGGIRDLAQADHLFHLGADKVVVNTGAIDDPGLITRIARKYGSQAVVVSIDARAVQAGEYRVYKAFGAVDTGLNPCDWARQAVDAGAGEVMVNSIDEDGSLGGYDHALCRSVIQAVSVPVYIAGGAGNWKHFEEGFATLGASAVCTTNIYHFSESAILNAKQYLARKGVNVRP